MRHSPSFGILLATLLIGAAATAETSVLTPAVACDDALTRATAVPPNFRVVQLNTENLFLKFERPIHAPLPAMDELEWQRLAPIGAPNKALRAIQDLAKALREIDADVIMLNEVGGLESLQNFARLFLDDAYDALLIPGNSPRGIEVGYLVRKSLGIRAELRTHRKRPLNFLYPFEEKLNAEYAISAPEKIRPSQCFARDCAELRLYAPGSETPALISLLVHLKAALDPNKVDPEGRLRRGAEARALMEIYRETRAEFSPPVPVLVAGDFNGHARSTARALEFKPLDDVDLRSVTELAGHVGADATTHVQGWYPMDEQEIDFIFVSPDLAGRLKTSEIFRYRDAAGKPGRTPRTRDEWRARPSDHYPVVAEFENPFAPVANAQPVKK